MKKISTRMIRINEEIKRELINIIRNELKDPRIGSLVSLMDVQTTNDLKHCKAFVSVMGKEEEKDDTIKGLQRAVGFIRKELARRLNLRNTPEIKFELDNSIEYSMKMSKIINEVNNAKGDSNE